jgi:Tol biopolymer transport system component
VEGEVSKGELRVLKGDTDSVLSVAWSLDGMCIAFASERGGNYEIYVMNADPSAGSGHSGSRVSP